MTQTSERLSFRLPHHYRDKRFRVSLQLSISGLRYQQSGLEVSLTVRCSR